MYHAMVKRIARKNFERVNQHDFDALLSDCVPNIRHQFAGHHALGGVRNDRQALRRWFERLKTVMPDLRLSVKDVWVKGWPHNTTIIIRWEARATLLDGSPYRNRGVHLVSMRWGKVVDIDAHEDSQAVVNCLAAQARNGVAEAATEPILS
jgi:ketosteroid isomerase-like protein